MAYDIGPRIGIEGEREYKQAISDIVNGQKVLRSELELVTAKFNGQDNSLEALTAKHDVLQRTLGSEQTKVDKLREALDYSTKTYGEADKRTSDWQVKLNKAETELEKTKQQISQTDEKLKKFNGTEDAAADKSKEFSDAQKNTGESMRGLGDMLDQVAGKFGVKLPDGLKSTLDGFGKVDGKALAFAGTAAVLVTALVKVEKKLIDLTKKSAEYADNILTMSTVTSISTERLQEYTYAAELLDVSVETITGSQTKLINNMQAASEGSAAQEAAFNRLGIRITDTNGKLRDSDDVFWEVIDALGRIESNTERDAVAMDLMGKSAQDLNPLIKAGSDAMDEFAAEAHKVGYVLDDEALAALGGVDDAMQRFNKTTEGAGNQLAVQFAPHLEAATNKATDFIAKTAQSLKETGVVDKFGELLENVAGMLDPIGDLIQWGAPGIASAFDVISGAAALLADTLRVIVGMLQVLSIVNIGKGVSNIKTGLGLNIKNGQLSAQQKITYRSSLDTNTYNSETGTWGSNYSDLEERWKREGVGTSFDYWLKLNGYNAGGTPNWRGGMTWVGENGPERVYLPKGTRIDTAQESRLGGDNFYITIDAKSVKEFNDIVELAKTARFTARMR